jgi:hypothetical protein
MSLKLIRAAARAENSDELHMARLLLLLKAFDREKDKKVEGIMKLAKLDFLLRYPNCLEKVLEIQKVKNSEEAQIKEYERNTVETKMIRFRYGPWDKRYRRWIGLLVAKGLVTTFVEKKTIYVGITEKGKEIAINLGDTEDFSVLNERSKLIIKAVGTLSATKLKDFVYENFPEILNMKWGEDIDYDF